jgi:hypothetical protein
MINDLTIKKGWTPYKCLALSVQVFLITLWILQTKP